MIAAEGQLIAHRALVVTMATVVSLAGILLGAAIAHFAGHYPRHQIIMETIGGALLLGGFGFLGYLLESIFGPPL
jgi:hypothetical protein